MLLLHFRQKIAKSLAKIKFWAEKATKIIKISDLFENADVIKIFIKFQCFHKKITKSVFFHQKTLINTKYKCQKKEKSNIKIL